MITCHICNIFSLLGFFVSFNGIYPQECDNDSCDINTVQNHSSPSKSSSEFSGNGQVSSVVETTNNETPIYWELNGLDQADPKLIQFLKENILIPPPGLFKKGKGIKGSKLNLTTRALTRESLKGQFGQAFVVEKLLNLPNKNRGKDQGFFIEAGACNGESISNSLYFEVAHGFTGLLVEPNPDFLDELKTKGRNAWILPHCLSVNRWPEVVQFDAHLFNGGIINTGDKGRSKPGDIGVDRKLKPVPKQINKRTLQMQCFPLYSVLQALNNPKVDYFSLDIEGAEYQVLKTVPWDKVDIRVVGVEIVHAGEVFDGSREEITNLLQENGYIYKDNAGHDQFFVNKITSDRWPKMKS